MFADHVQVEHNRAALWRGREYGRAAVFVGGGFSCNAQAAATAPRPLWTELACVLVDQLYAPPAAPAWKRDATLRQAESTSGDLRLVVDTGRGRLTAYLNGHVLKRWPYELLND